MLEVMLDTKLCIYVLRQRLPDLAKRFFESREKLCISSVVLAELRFGARKSQWKEANLRALDDFVGQVAVLPLTADVTPHYAEIRATLELAATPVGPNDLFIGAHARSLDLTLVTNNRREFDRMPGLKVENWV